jgi:hypothetical protein
MSVITIQDFSGMMPLRDALLLPDRNAQYAMNTWLYKGAIRGFRHAIHVCTVVYDDTKQLYRIPKTDANPPDFSATGSKWLEFPDEFMSAIRNPVVGDQWNRYYFFPSDQYRKKDPSPNPTPNPDWPTTKPTAMYRTYDPDTDTLGPLLLLGIPTPAQPPTVTAAPSTVTLTASAPTPNGDTVLHFADTTGVTEGMGIADLTNVTVWIATNAATMSGNILHFASTTGVLVGMTVIDYSNSPSLIFNTLVTAVTSTTVTLSQNVASAGVLAGDAIKFVNIALPTPPTVSAVSSSQVTMSSGAQGAGVLTGDQIEFDANTIENRAYVYTYVSAYGEEGPASQPTNTTGNPTGAWQITIPAPTAGITTNRNLTKVRLYRTVVDSAGNASYYQVHEFDWGPFPINYTDSALATTIVNNSPLTSELYTAPPDDLQGVVMMANGIAAGWSNKREIWFSAAYLPHAWPASYALTVDYPIVGLTANGASLNIMCEGAPSIATGVTPDTMTIGKISSNEPCIGRGSIVSSGEGAYYASPNGIILLNSSGTINVTQYVYEKEFHNTLTPWNWAAGHYGISYIAFIKGNGLSSIDPDGAMIRGMAIDHQDKNVPFTYLHFGNPVRNMYFDELSGQLFGLLDNKTVMQWNPPIGNPGTTALWDWAWKSKQFRMAFPCSMKVIEIIYDVPPEVTFVPGVRNVDQNQIYDPDTQYLIVKVYADGRFVMVKEVQENKELLLIPDGFKATLWELEMQGIVNVKFLKAATSVKELRKG